MEEGCIGCNLTSREKLHRAQLFLDARFWGGLCSRHTPTRDQIPENEKFPCKRSCFAARLMRLSGIRPRSPIPLMGREGGARAPRGGAGQSEGATCSLPHRTRPENEPHLSLGRLVGPLEAPLETETVVKRRPANPGAPAQNRLTTN